MTQPKQTLLLNMDAMLMHSCDSLFATPQFTNQNIILHFPFLESIFEELLERLKEEPRIIFKGIETKHQFLPGYYDYAFSLVHTNDKQLIQWQIIDETDTYNAMKVEQQSKNEKIAFSDKKSSKPNQ